MPRSAWQLKLAGERVTPDFDNIARGLIESLYFSFTGENADLVTSTWDAQLTEGERALAREKHFERTGADAPEYQPPPGDS